MWLSNEGFRISTIMTQLREEPELKANPLIEVLFSPAYADSRQAAPLSRPALDVHLTSPVIRPAVADSCTGPADQHQHQRRRGHTGGHDVDDPDVRHVAQRDGDRGGAVRGRARLLRLRRVRRALHGRLHPDARAEDQAAQETRRPDRQPRRLHAQVPPHQHAAPRGETRPDRERDQRERKASLRRTRRGRFASRQVVSGQPHRQGRPAE